MYVNNLTLNCDQESEQCTCIETKLIAADIIQHYHQTLFFLGGVTMVNQH